MHDSLINKASLAAILLALVVGLFVGAESIANTANGSTTTSEKNRLKAMDNAAAFARDGDYARAYCIYAKYASKDDPEAQYLIGWMYHNGYGLKIDDKKASIWWEKAGKQNHAEALFALGQLYYHGGRGVRRNITKSVNYFLPAAENSHDEAKLLLKILIAVNHPSVGPKRKAIIKALGGQAAEALKITASKANIRRAPSTSAGLVKRLKKGDILAEISRKDEWIQVGIPETGQVGWVFYSLVDRAQKSSLKRTVIGE